MRVYISGPISSLTQAQYEDNFAKAEKFLRSEGHEPVSPLKAKACPDESCQINPIYKESGDYLHTWQCYMRYDLIELLTCDGILMLPGYQESKGANIELYVAKSVGMKWRILNSWYDGII